MSENQVFGQAEGAAREFVLAKKSNKMQTKKIIELVERILY